MELVVKEEKLSIMEKQIEDINLLTNKIAENGREQLIHRAENLQYESSTWELRKIYIYKKKTFVSLIKGTAK